MRDISIDSPQFLAGTPKPSRLDRLARSLVVQRLSGIGDADTLGRLRPELEFAFLKANGFFARVAEQSREAGVEIDNHPVVPARDQDGVGRGMENRGETVLAATQPMGGIQ